MTARISLTAGRLMRRQYGALIPSLTILFFFGCLGAYSAEPKAAPAPSANAPAKSERMMVVVTNRMQTMKGFFGQREFPYSSGNNVTILQVKPAPPDGMETHTDLRVVNILAENLTEILKRLGTETIELAIYPKTNYVSTFQGREQIERKVNLQIGYAVITDTRIPREWFLFSPSLGNFPSIKPDQILADFPQSFRPIPTQ